jgi:hypothetical protein
MAKLSASMNKLSFIFSLILKWCNKTVYTKPIHQYKSHKKPLFSGYQGTTST